MDGCDDVVWRQLSRDSPPPNPITTTTPGVGNSCRETARTLAPPPPVMWVGGSCRETASRQTKSQEHLSYHYHHPYHYHYHDH